MKVLKGKQALYFHMVTGGPTPRHCGFFGGYGSGKTTGACVAALHLTLQQPGVTGAIIRNTHPMLRTNTKKVFMDLVEEYDEGVPESRKVLKGRNDQYNIVTFHNGATVYFLHAQSEALFKGPEFGWYLIDQAEEVEEAMIERITTRLRQPGYLQKAMYVGNTDKGHNWCYRWFKLKQRANSGLVEITFLDNAENLKGGVLEDLLAQPEEWKKINLYGSWDSPGGLVIEPTQDHCLKPFRIPEKWKKGIIIDPADTTGTTAVLFGAVDFNDNYYVCDEYYEKFRLIKDHALGIKKVWARFNGEPEHLAVSFWEHFPPNFCYADPRSWKRQQSMETDFITLSDRYLAFGINAVPAVNAMQVGIDLLRERHEPNRDRQHPITGKCPAPGIYFFKENINGPLSENITLPNLWEEVHSWMIEEPDKEPCHAVDALRYFVATSPSAPKRPLMVRALRSKSFMAM